MRIIGLMCLLIGLAGCGRLYPSVFIDKDFASHVLLFEGISGRQVNLPIVYGEVPGNFIGVCKTWADGHKEVHINELWWKSKYTTYSDQIALIFHELGHCVLGRGHLNEFSDGAPVSIMNHYNIGHWYEGNEDYYDSELIHPGETSEGSSGKCVLHMD